jgi:hypothetical protein
MEAQSAAQDAADRARAGGGTGAATPASGAPRPASPQVLTTASGKQVSTGTVGVPGYLSSALLPSKEGTVDGDVFNQFRGYVGPQGGTFGGGASADPQAARRAWESVSGVSGDKLGDTSGWDAAKWDDARRTFGGIANRDKDTTLNALKSDNQFVKDTANRYATENGWLEGVGPARPVPVVPSGPVPPNNSSEDDLASAVPSDIYGRTDSPLSTRPVMKASDTFESLQAQARQRMATPQMTSPTAKLPSTGTVPQNPFDQFNAAGAPAPQTAGAPVPTTFAADTMPPPEAAVPYNGVQTTPSDTEQAVPLPGGVQSTPTGDEEAILSPRILESPVSMMSSPASGGMGAAASAGGTVAGGASFGGAPGGLRKIGGKRNPLMPESRQDSGLFRGGLRKLKSQQAPSPTGGPVSNISAY